LLSLNSGFTTAYRQWIFDLVGDRGGVGDWEGDGVGGGVFSTSYFGFFLEAIAYASSLLFSGRF